jgi:DNA-binding GntR family transcriptional regulator
LRRLELRLPDDHPIWRVPDRLRASTARRWLELGAAVEEAERGLEERLAAVEARLAALERAVAAGPPAEPAGGRKIDAAAFARAMAAFD